MLETQLKKWSDNTSYVHTTLVGQLALYLVMWGPVQMAADLPENYAKYNDAFQFIKDVAVDWQDSRYIDAEPARYITVARKAKGSDNWFVGGKCDEHGHKVNVKLDFLDAAALTTAPSMPMPRTPITRTTLPPTPSHTRRCAAAMF